MNDPIIFTSPEEYRARPNYQLRLMCKKEDLQGIIGVYEFDKLVECNLMKCKEDHKRGYIVVLKDGRETNCGKDCGRREFGEIEFNEFIKSTEEKIRRKQVRDNLEKLFDELGDYKKQLSALEPIASKNKSLIDEINTILEKDKTAQTTILNSDGKIVKYRLATEKEKKNLLHLKDNPYISEDIGFVKDFDCLGMSFPVRDAIRTARITINELEQLDINSIKQKDMEKHSLKSNDIKRSLLTLKEFNEKAGRFFSEQNINELMKFQEILKQDRPKRLLNQIKKAVDDYRATN